MPISSLATQVSPGYQEKESGVEFMFPFKESTLGKKGKVESRTHKLG